MKKLMIITSLLAVTVLAGTIPQFTAGETITLEDGTKVYAESVTSTNLQNVILYEYDDKDQLKSTAQAETADYTITEAGEVKLTLHNATIETKDEDGISTTVKAKSFPLVLNKK